MPSSAPYNARLAAAADRRADGTGRQVRRVGRRIDRWTRELEIRLLGLVSAGRGGVDGVMGSVDVVLIGAVAEGAEILEDGLRDVWDWAWDRVTRDWIKAVPLGYWIRRLAPVKMLTATEGDRAAAGTQQVHKGTQLLEYTLSDEADWEKILAGTAARAEAFEIVRKAEFGTPRPELVEQILDSTNAPDGLSAMQRIKTVAQKDLGQLRSAIRTAMSGDFEGASAVRALSAQIKPILSVNEGINYKAKRIARTEGIRVAAAAQMESERAVVDMLQGQLVKTSQDANVRDEHRARWDPPKMYLRTGGGYGFVAADGESWPGKEPYGPNCRCMSVPVLHDELYAPLPDELPVRPQPPVVVTPPKAKPTPKPKPKLPWYHPDRPIPKGWGNLERERERLQARSAKLYAKRSPRNNEELELLSKRTSALSRRLRDIQQEEQARLATLSPMEQAHQGLRTPWRKYRAGQIKARMLREEAQLEAKRLKVLKSAERTETKVRKLQGRMEKLSDEWEQIQREKPVYDESEVMVQYKLEDHLKKAKKRQIEIVWELDAIAQKQRTALTNRLNNAMKSFEVEHSAKVKAFTGTELDKGTKESVERARKFYQGKLDRKRHGKGMISNEAGQFDFRAHQIPKAQEQRAFAGHTEIHLGRSEDFATVVHEIGHVLEADPEVNRMAQGFLTKRAGRKRPKHFKTEWPDLDYRDYEHGIEDDFRKAFKGIHGPLQARRSAHYVGKYYARSTEITSMGVELMARDPVAFAQNDPEYFRFIAGILDGSLLQ
jgi:hypothetical protein